MSGAGSDPGSDARLVVLAAGVRSDPAARYTDTADFRADCATIAAEMLASRGHRGFERDALRAAVARCAEGARRAGCPPERFLAELKRSLREQAPPDVNRWLRDMMKDRIVSWAIAAYYGGAGEDESARGA